MPWVRILENILTRENRIVGVSPSEGNNHCVAHWYSKRDTLNAVDSSTWTHTCAIDRGQTLHAHVKRRVPAVKVVHMRRSRRNRPPTKNRKVNFQHSGNAALPDHVFIYLFIVVGDFGCDFLQSTIPCMPRESLWPVCVLLFCMQFDLLVQSKWARTWEIRKQPDIIYGLHNRQLKWLNYRQ